MPRLLLVKPDKRFPRRDPRRRGRAVVASPIGQTSHQLARLGWIFFVCAAFTLLIACYWIGGDLSYSDERDYVEIARSLTTGEGYNLDSQPTAFRPPTWVLVLSPAAAAGATNQVLSLIPATCLIAAALLAARVVTRTADARWGVVAALAVLLYPLNAYSATTLYPQMLAMTLLMWLWVLMMRLTDRQNLSRSDALLTGFLCATLALAVPTMIYSAGAFLAYMLYRHRRRLRFFMLAGVGFGVPILVWATRNLLVMGSPILFSTSSGINLLLGNNPNATSSSGVRPDITVYLQQANRMGLGEIARNDFLTASALQWIRSDPASAASLYLGKLINYFSAYNAPATSGHGSNLQAVVAWAAMLVVVALVVIRIILSRGGLLPMSKHEKFMLFLFVTNGPFMAIFFTRTRFRQPLDVILIVEAALAVAALVLMNSHKAKRGAPSADNETSNSPN